MLEEVFSPKLSKTIAKLLLIEHKLAFSRGNLNGRKSMRAEVVSNMLASGLTIDEIARLTNFEMDAIKYYANID
ncbi:MAG: hypothetical protein LBN08_04180 [Lactobacillales bacterium]|jgi:DNA-binding NarL/FixJ family response regulator|nr:hypothetical protein [Lactobacillales bacterium]